MVCLGVSQMAWPFGDRLTCTNVRCQTSDVGNNGQPDNVPGLEFLMNLKKVCKQLHEFKHVLIFLLERVKLEALLIDTRKLACWIPMEQVHNALPDAVWEPCAGLRKDLNEGAQISVDRRLTTLATRGLAKHWLRLPVFMHLSLLQTGGPMTVTASLLSTHFTTAQMLGSFNETALVTRFNALILSLRNHTVQSLMTSICAWPNSLFVLPLQR